MCEKKNEGCLLSGLNSWNKERNWFVEENISESFHFRLGHALCQTVHLFCFGLEGSVGVEFHVSIAVFKQLFQRRFYLKKVKSSSMS